jgi:hypothetical protein
MADSFIWFILGLAAGIIIMLQAVPDGTTLDLNNMEIIYKDCKER